MQSLKLQVQELTKTLAAKSEEINELKTKVAVLEDQLEENAREHETKVAVLEDQLEQAMKKLSLSENIRVFARVRSPIHSEQEKSLCGLIFSDDEKALEISQERKKHDFAFDHVFNQNSTQEEIFESVAPLIQSALDGYNVCVFAYGKWLI